MEKHLVRFVVDSNCLRSNDLRKFLEESRDNYAVLTEYAAIEAYKNGSLRTACQSMGILSEFPDQVLVLWGASEASRLTGGITDSMTQLVDARSTREFGVYCERLAQAVAGHEGYRQQLVDHQRAARELIRHMDGQLASMGQAFVDLRNDYDRESVAAIRKGEAIPVAGVERFVRDSLALASALFETHPAVAELPDLENLLDTFIFRFALCGQLLVLRWIESGGAEASRVDRHRNDIIDCNFAAFASFFDGLLTRDKRLQRMFGDLVVVIDLLSGGVAERNDETR